MSVVQKLVPIGLVLLTWQFPSIFFHTVGPLTRRESFVALFPLESISANLKFPLSTQYTQVIFIIGNNGKVKKIYIGKQYWTCDFIWFDFPLRVGVEPDYSVQPHIKPQ